MAGPMELTIGILLAEVRSKSQKSSVYRSPLYARSYGRRTTEARAGEKSAAIIPADSIGLCVGSTPMECSPEPWKRACPQVFAGLYSQSLSTMSAYGCR
eukprot:290380-Rhodomonas_salina.2